MLTYKRPSKRLFAWRFGFMFSFILLALGVVMGVFGRIDYRYHIGSKQVAGVIRAGDSPFLFWIIIGSLICVSVIGTIATGVGYFRVKQKESDGA
jgi:hypothetical protein